MSEFVAYLTLVVACLSLGPGSVIIISGQGQTTDVQVLERGDDWQCPPMEERERARNRIHQIANSAILAAIATGHIHTCNGTPGWRRVAFINMTDTSYNCPTGLNLTSYSKRTCGRSHTTDDGGCSSTTFSVGGLPYSRVCGRIRGYQFGATSAFQYYTRGIGSYYVDGVSLTHGGAGSRQHIWTFAAGVTEVDTRFLSERCPCDTHNYDRVPVFVGDDFFVRVPYTLPGITQIVLYSTPMMFSGMVKTVHPTAHAVSSTTLHGLQRTYPEPQLMKLN